MTLKNLAVAILISALSCVATHASAASVIGDRFEASLTIEGTTFGPFSGVADSSAGISEFFSGDAGLNGQLSVTWVDEDSVDVEFFVGGLTGDLQGASFSLSGLDFVSGGEPRDIVGVTFNRAASNVDEFDAGSTLVGPDLTFTSTAFTGTVSMSVALAADGPRLRYDVQTSTIPEPATFALVFLGLTALSVVWRRTASCTPIERPL